MGSDLSKEQKVYPQLLQQLHGEVGCKVKEQYLTQLLQTVKEYYPAFPDQGTLDVKVWEDVSDRLRSLQDSGVSIRIQNLITWGLVRTALLPIWARRPKLVTKENKESSSEEKDICNVPEEPATKVLPPAPPDLLHSQSSLLQPWEHSSSQDDSPLRQPENLDRYSVRAM